MIDDELELLRTMDQARVQLRIESKQYANGDLAWRFSAWMRGGHGVHQRVRVTGEQLYAFRGDVSALMYRGLSFGLRFWFVGFFPSEDPAS